MGWGFQKELPTGVILLSGDKMISKQLLHSSCKKRVSNFCLVFSFYILSYSPSTFLLQQPGLISSLRMLLQIDPGNRIFCILRFCSKGNFLVFFHCFSLGLAQMSTNVCVQMCVSRFKYTRVHVKGRDQCSNQNCSHFILGGQGLTLNLELADLARLTGQQAPGMCMSCLCIPSAGITGAYSWPSVVGYL